MVGKVALHFSSEITFTFIDLTPFSEELYLSQVIIIAAIKQKKQSLS